LLFLNSEQIAVISAESPKNATGWKTIPHENCLSERVCRIDAGASVCHYAVGLVAEAE